LCYNCYDRFILISHAEHPVFVNERKQVTEWLYVMQKTIFSNECKVSCGTL
jgi:hypothetical protein